MQDWKDKRTKDLSKGMQQKVQFITSVIHEPDLLILDEPIAGLDPLVQQSGEYRSPTQDPHNHARELVEEQHDW